MAGNAHLRIGTRGSKLALVQAREVLEGLSGSSNRVKAEVVKITTRGDVAQDRSLSSMGGTGLFVKELERALLDGRIDVAVHCVKDLPVEMPDGLTIAAVTKRMTPFDVLISRGGKILDDLPSGATIGTGSPRRAAQLLNYRPDFVIEDIRGNLDTRIAKLESGAYDAIVVAAAGVERLGLQDRVSEIFTAELCIPAPGQGALAIQVRSDHKEAARVVKRLDHAESHRQIRAERAFLKRLGAGCHVPAGALCVREEEVVSLEGMIASPDGHDMFRDVEEGSPGEEAKLGVRLADRLMESGAASILESLDVEQ
jgi:hydroxymethylbilane synthase